MERSQASGLSSLNDDGAGTVSTSARNSGVMNGLSIVSTAHDANLRRSTFCPRRSRWRSLTAALIGFSRASLSIDRDAVLEAVPTALARGSPALFIDSQTRASGRMLCAKRTPSCTLTAGRFFQVVQSGASDTEMAGSGFWDGRPPLSRGQSSSSLSESFAEGAEPAPSSDLSARSASSNSAREAAVPLVSHASSEGTGLAVRPCLPAFFFVTISRPHAAWRGEDATLRFGAYAQAAVLMSETRQFQRRPIG